MMIADGHKTHPYGGVVMLGVFCRPFSVVEPGIFSCSRRSPECGASLWDHERVLTGGLHPFSPKLSGWTRGPSLSWKFSTFSPVSWPSEVLDRQVSSFH